MVGAEREGVLRGCQRVHVKPMLSAGCLSAEVDEQPATLTAALRISGASRTGVGAISPREALPFPPIR
jgi:hypothetical protein